TLAYDGAGFVGWQRQARGTSIQGLLEEICATLDGAPVTVEGAGRTDAGVHALAQTATVSLARDITAATFVRALNAHLPETVRVLSATLVGDEFHARFSAVAKAYRYRLWNDPILPPFERAYVWHVPWPRLDVDAMQRAADLLRGTHDFSAFTGAGSRTRTHEREILSVTVARHVDADGRGDGLITLDICGNGFLKHMVRNITGTLVDVGRGTRRADEMSLLLQRGDRHEAGRTAPARGLFLVKVFYERPDL
ncbi:MAG: tRNA pseudouridine(38-40) synthase TruA, partial [Acidobacteriaceae bacterium]|nr:tRNA pseudouridine(38-40) synthase TruA [Acidobacteriaceae bacterium]